MIGQHVGGNMKKRLFSILVAFIFVLSMVSTSVLASGDDSGSDIDNAYPVYSNTELIAALADPSVNVVETVGIFNGTGITVPSGKTLIIRSVPDQETAYFNFTSYLVVNAGGTLINEGGLCVGYYFSLIVRGTVINRGSVYQSRIDLEAGGTFTNEAGGLINERCIVMAYGGTFANAGTVRSSVYQVQTASPATVSGVPASLLGTTGDSINYTDMTYSPLSIPASVTRTVGLPGDDSTFIVDPDGYDVFAIGYSLSLTAGQTVVVQTKTDYRAYFYLLNSGFSSVQSASNTGLLYTAPVTGTYHLLVGGYDTYDTGTFTVTVYDPVDLTHPLIDLTLELTDPGYVASGTGWSWDSVSRTLLLSGIEMTGSVLLPSDSTIELEAGTDNFIRSLGYGYAISSLGDLDIIGSGNLTVNSPSSGIVANGFLQFSVAGSLSVSASGYGMYSASGIDITGCPSVLVNAESIGIFSGGDVRITNSNVHVYGYGYGICTGETQLPSSGDGGDIIIEDSKVYAYCDHVYGDAAIYAGDTLSPSDLVGHSQILLTDSAVALPEVGRVVDVNVMMKNCQTITSLQDITTVTNWDQAAKIVRINPAYNVLYDGNGGTGSLMDPLNAYWRNETVNVRSNAFTRSGYAFDSWNTAANGSGSAFDPADTFSIVAGVTLYAQWLPVYTVTFNDHNGTLIATRSVVSGQGATAPSDPTRSGYTFAGWDAAFTSVTSNLVITALYDAAPTPTPTPTPGGVARTGEDGSTDITPFIFLGIGLIAAGMLFFIRKKGAFES